MNVWRYLCDHARGMVKGEQFYRQTVDTGKALAPVAGPVVQQILTTRGLPINAASALRTLTAQAVLSPSLPRPIVAELAEYVAAHLPAPTVSLPAPTVGGSPQ